MNFLSCSEREEIQEGRMIIELRNVHANRELLILFCRENLLANKKREPNEAG